MMAYEGSKSGRDNFGKFIYQFQPETKTLIRKLERILNKLYKRNLSLLFNETCLNEWLLPNYTIYIYIYIYIYVYVCNWTQNWLTIIEKYFLSAILSKFSSWRIKRFSVPLISV